MLFSELTSYLEDTDQLIISLPDGSLVPSHFHVTEVGEVTRRFIDCGGIRREERLINLQLWSADDYNHRLAPDKLAYILTLAERELRFGNLELEVEYQGGETIQKYGLAVDGDTLRLTGKATDCLARDNCGVSPAATMISLNDYRTTNCIPGSGCC